MLATGRSDGTPQQSMVGIVGVQEEVVLASRRAGHRRGDRRRADARARSRRLPHWVIEAVAPAPRGTAPSCAHGYYDRDNSAYRAWDAISRDREKFGRRLGDLKAVAA